MPYTVQYFAVDTLRFPEFESRRQARIVVLIAITALTALPHHYFVSRLVHKIYMNMFFCICACTASEYRFNFIPTSRFIGA